MTALQLRGKTINKVVLLELDQIEPNPAQPRLLFSQEELQSLAQSIAENGLLQPLTVRKVNGRYELISGERRLRALRLAGMKAAPCIVVSTTDEQSAVYALLENIQRADLNFFEEALALKKLMCEWGISQQELGARLGKAQPTIANKLRLLKFTDETQRLILNSNISERQARCLLKLPEEEVPAAVAQIQKQGMNTAQTEHYVQALLERKEEEDKPKKKYYPIVKDVRVFLNTINKAITVMNASGIAASTCKIEKEDCIEYVVKIPIAN